MHLLLRRRPIECRRCHPEEFGEAKAHGDIFSLAHERLGDVDTRPVAEQEVQTCRQEFVLPLGQSGRVREMEAELSDFVDIGGPHGFEGIQYERVTARNDCVAVVDEDLTCPEYPSGSESTVMMALRISPGYRYI